MTGSIVVGFTYITSIGRGEQNWNLNLLLIAPVLTKLLILLICIMQKLEFNSVIFLTELSQLLVCIILVVYKLKDPFLLNSKINLKINFKEFIIELKNYGYQGFIMIPISYIKTNVAILFASTSLDADSTFGVLFIQRLFDQFKSALSRPNMLLSGFKSERQKISMIWLVPGLITTIIAITADYMSLQIVLIFLLVRLSDMCIFISCYRIFGDYLKLQSFKGFNRYTFVPEIIFLSIFITANKTIEAFILLILFRAYLGLLSWYYFSRERIY